MPLDERAAVLKAQFVAINDLLRYKPGFEGCRPARRDLPFRAAVRATHTRVPLPAKTHPLLSHLFRNLVKC
jgi:hypothetical protein